jgi:hypothetical protein
MKMFIKHMQGASTLLAALLTVMGPKAMAQTHSEPANSHGHKAPPAAPFAAPSSGREGKAPLSWQDANQAVGQFPRGHADLLRWEKTNTPQTQDVPATSEAGQLTLARAIRLALQEEAKWLEPGMSALEQAQVRQQAAALRWQVQKLWVDAVVSRQSVALSRDIVAVAEAGAELGQRMAQVGNWSRARQIQEELPLWEARTRLDKAQLQAERTSHALWQRVGAGMTVQAMAQQLPLHLPNQLPERASENMSQQMPQQVPDLATSGALEVPALAPLSDVAALQAQALRANLRWALVDLQAQRLMAGLGLSAADLQAAEAALIAQSGQAGQDAPLWNPRTLRWGHEVEAAWQARRQADRLARQIRADVRVAVTALQVARQTAHNTQAEVLRLHTELLQETGLRYNGMLKSTWDLLASARTRIDSVAAALQAQRQAWLAQADLAAVLVGLPYAPGTDAADASQSTNPTNPNTAGH